MALDVSRRFFAELDRLYRNKTSHGKRTQDYGQFINKHMYESINNEH